MYARRICPRPLRAAFSWTLVSALTILAAVFAPGLHAQAAALTPPTVAELRLVSHGFGRAAVVGTDGKRYGDVGWFDSDLEALQQESPSVAARIRVFKRERAVGTALLAVGAGIVAGSLYQYAHGDRFSTSTPATAVYVGGSTAALLGLVRLSISQQNLRAALQLHNRR